jgi:hypothetical protein
MLGPTGVRHYSVGTDDPSGECLCRLTLPR